MRETLHLFLRRAKGFNPKSAATFPAALEVAPEAVVTREPVRVWPELPVDVATTGVEEGRRIVVPGILIPDM